MAFRGVARTVLLAASLSLTTAAVAFAQGPPSTCIPQAAWIPNLSRDSVGPVWLPPDAGSTAWRAQLDDPRWAGGPVSFFSFPSPISEQSDAFYRAVATYPNAPGVSQIYGAIQVRVDPDGPDPADSVFFGLTQGSAAAGAYLIRIFPELASTPPVDGGVPHDPQYPRPNSPSTISLYQRDPNPPHLWSLQGNPPWLKNVATWLGSPGVNWAVTFQIDTSSSTGITLGNGAQVLFGTRLG